MYINYLLDKDFLRENGVDIDEIKTMPYGSMFSFKDQDGNAYLIREDLVY